MPLAPGDRLGNFEILAKIGAGGMGEVYKARDTRLDRIVAIKTSKQQFTERFDREARAVAQLNHPNICTLHDVGPNFLVMEFVEGAPLKGPLPTDEVLRIAHQITAALEAAHEKHITHRDLKPANVMLKPDGQVKVLDFGLAKLAPPPRADLDPENSPTLTMSMTDAGMVVGTAAYMAPEQAKGSHVDKRADIWSFGVVLYELLTGKRPFHGNDIAEILASVIKEQPDYEPVPQEFRRLIKKCLEKDPAKRLRDIGDVWELLDQPAPELIVVAAPPPRSSKLWPVLAACFALVAGGTTYLAWQASRPPDRPLLRLSVDLGPDASRQTVHISPDGTRIVYITQGGAAMRELDQPSSTAMASPVGQFGVTGFSPDGEWVLQFKAADGLYKTSVRGGAPVALAKYGVSRGTDWLPNGDIVVSAAENPSNKQVLAIAPADGGPLRYLTKPSDVNQSYPQALPDGDTILFTSVAGDMEASAVSVLSIKSGKVTEVRKGGYFGRYLPTFGSTGHLVWMSNGALFGIKFDPASLQTSGQPQPLVDDINVDATAVARMTFSRTGTLVYLPRPAGRQGDRLLTWLDASGKLERLPLPAGNYASVQLSPDGKRIAVGVSTPPAVHIYDIARETLAPPLTSAPVQPTHSAWSPDGQHLVLKRPARSGQKAALLWVRADAAGQPEVLFESKLDILYISFSPTGKDVVFGERGSDDRLQLWSWPLDLTDPQHPKAGSPSLLAGEGQNAYSRISPDGHWIAYASRGVVASSFTLEIRPFPDVASGRFLIGPGTIPRWRGKQLFWVGPDNRVMVVDYSVTGSQFVASKPRVWSEGKDAGIFDVAPDGRVLTAESVTPNQQGNLHATFLLNFFDEVRRRIP